MNLKDAFIETLFKCVNHQGSVVFDGRSIRFDVSDKAELESGCNQVKLPYEFHLNNQFEIRIDKPCDDGKLIFFFTEDDFVNRGIDFLANFDQTRFVILKHPDKPLQKLPNETFLTEKALFFNYFNYENILTFLEKQEHFMSVHSRPDLQFVIFTSEKGPFHIGYNLHEPRVKNIEDLGPVYENLKAELQKIDFVQFFKAAVINTIHEYGISERFFHLVQSLRVILNVAQRDHYIYIRNFDFDKIKSKFKEERNKYLESIEKNIESVNKQVSSFPLTFAASAFAGFQVKDKPFILILIAGAYCVYTIIAYRVLNIAAFNIDGIRSDVTHESNQLKKTYEIIYDDFKGDFDKIETKMSKIDGLISILKSALIALVAAFLIFSFYEIFFVDHSVAKSQ